MENIQWICKKFNDLNNLELYHLLRLRSRVFVVEQYCIFEDMDGYDTHDASIHLLAYCLNELVAYARIMSPETIFEYPSIGRVCTNSLFRGKGLGKLLMQKAIAITHATYPHQPIKIGAQYYLKKFYSEFGFIAETQTYLEDGIEHVIMEKPH